MKLRIPISITMLLSLFVSCSRCTLPAPGVSRTVSILSYNVENLFDDRDDGTEYREYDPGAGTWDTALYHTKLRNISESIRSSARGGPDICLLQEVENEKVVEDLLDGYLNILKYRGSYTASSPDTATTVAALSRYVPKAVRVHRVHTEGRQRLRTILELEFEIHGKPLVILNNHWKSKSGGAEETEELRLKTAAFVRDRVEELLRARPGLFIVVAGDLNERDIEYDSASRAYQTALLLDSYTSPEGYTAGSLFLSDSWKNTGVSNGRVVFFSPWLLEHEEGSYVYNGVWERIDHFLLIGSDEGYSFDSFEVVRSEQLLNTLGFPRRWSTRTATGYSDHLPLLIRLRQ
ncbi:MAG: hypothetical protein HN368_12965 [Spirochaetales bacterium]|jgi:endonuclease/exonuclease/phosphatase family metal-dependent hydrolase|nr:hypothetical protein [Spirochaetales bacterium]